MLDTGLPQELGHVPNIPNGPGRKSRWLMFHLKANTGNTVEISWPFLVVPRAKPTSGDLKQNIKSEK
jgi:hypothetical protein